MSLAIAEDLDAMRTAEAVSLLFILFCRDHSFGGRCTSSTLCCSAGSLMGRCGYERR